MSDGSLRVPGTRVGTVGEEPGEPIQLLGQTRHGQVDVLAGADPSIQFLNAAGEEADRVGKAAGPAELGDVLLEALVVLNLERAASRSEIVLQQRPVGIEHDGFFGVVDRLLQAGLRAKAVILLSATRQGEGTPRRAGKW